jgi:hypothetical protein
MGLDLVEIVMEIEDEFGITVPDALAEQCITVGDTQKMIVDLLVARGEIRSAELEARVWDGLVTLTSEQMGMKREAIRPELRWVTDIAPNG